MDTKPYKIRERIEKEAGYRGLIRAELADELYYNHCGAEKIP